MPFPKGPDFISRKHFFSLPHFAHRMREAVSMKVKGQYVTLAIDGGKVHHKLQSLSIICDRKAYYLTSVAVLHNDTQTILGVLQRGKNLVDGMGAEVVAVVGDNHAGIQAAIRLFL